jgi:hypothetical protein
MTELILVPTVWCKGCREILFLPHPSPGETPQYPFDRPTEFWPAFLGCWRCGQVFEYLGLDVRPMTQGKQFLDRLRLVPRFLTIYVRCVGVRCTIPVCIHLYVGETATTETALDGLRRENFGPAQCGDGHAADPLAEPDLGVWSASDLL